MSELKVWRRPGSFYNTSEFHFIQSYSNLITLNGNSAWLCAVWKQRYDFYVLVGCKLLTASLFPRDWKSSEWVGFSAKCISKVSLVLESSFITSTMRALSQPFLHHVDRSCHWLLIWDEVNFAAGEVSSPKGAAQVRSGSRPGMMKDYERLWNSEDEAWMSLTNLQVFTRWMSVEVVENFSLNFCL